MAKKSKKTTSRTGYKSFIQEFSSYLKQSETKLKGRGIFFVEASKMWKEAKGKPRIEENYDVFIESYQSSKNVKRTKRAPTGLIKKFTDLIENSGYTVFNWWEGPTIFEKITLTDDFQKFKPLIKVTDDDGESREFSSYNDIYANLYNLIKSDFKKESENYYPNYSDYPVFEFINVYNQNSTTYIHYAIKYWFFAYWGEGTRMPQPDSIADILKKPGVKKPEEDKKPEKDPKPTIDTGIELEKFKIKTEAERKEKAYETELQSLERLLEKKVINFKQYKEERDNLREFYGFKN